MVLDPVTLRNKACTLAAFDDFGPGPLDAGLQVFCESLCREAILHAVGTARAESQILDALVQRLKVQDWLNRHPEIDQQRITAPIMVFGLPRSGTTALSQYLSEDPALRSVRRWEAAELTPPPEAATEASDPRIAATREAFAARDAAVPSLMSMLPVTAEDPSEHGGLLALTFQSLSLSGLWPVRSYERWALDCDMEPAYAYLARILKLLQWRCPPRLWNLKYPLDLFFLDEVRSVFPDALFVWCHRDPARAVPSVASLLHTFRAMVTDHVDKHALGRAELEQKLEGVTRAMDHLDRAGEETVYHVHNAELARDPVRTIAGLYEQIGRRFTGEFETALRKRLAQRPRGKFGAHRYTAEEFGLNEAQIRKTFAGYMDRFRVVAER